MSSLSKLIQLWNNDRFVPGGQTVSNSLPSDNETKRERSTKLHHDRTIVRDIRDGIAILNHAVNGLEKTQEFNRDPSAFKGNTREILMSDDFLMVAHVLRLVFPEGMMSELRPRKRGRDEVDDEDDNNNHEEGGTRKYRPLLTPKGPSQLVSRPKQGPINAGTFGSSGGFFRSTKPTPSTAMHNIWGPSGATQEQRLAHPLFSSVDSSTKPTPSTAMHNIWGLSGATQEQRLARSPFSSSGFASSNQDEPRAPLSASGSSSNREGQEKDKQAQLSTGSSFLSSFSDVRLLDEDKGPGLVGAQSVKRSDEEELNPVLAARKDGEEQKVDLNKAPDLISFH